jgi:hypothetical protein
MCLTPKRRPGARWAALALLAACGCQQAHVVTPEPLQTEPIIEDDAMRLRQWSQTSATYPNGATVAGPTGFGWQPRRGQADWKYYYADGGVFFANLFALPYRLIKTPPDTAVTYRGVWIEPTFHAMPALPPEPAMPAPPPEAPPEPAPPPEAVEPPPAAPATQPGA